MDSLTFNELALIPHLILEGEWSNDPQHARQAILGFLAGLPTNTWWSLSAFVSDIHQAQPDFQRPSGDYDSWFIRYSLSGDYLRGFEHWDQVDGELIRFTFAAHFNWLGIVDLASQNQANPLQLFGFRVGDHPCYRGLHHQAWLMKMIRSMLDQMVACACHVACRAVCVIK